MTTWQDLRRQIYSSGAGAAANPFAGRGGSGPPNTTRWRWVRQWDMDSAGECMWDIVCEIYVRYMGKILDTYNKGGVAVVQWWFNGALRVKTKNLVALNVQYRIVRLFIYIYIHYIILYSIILYYVMLCYIISYHIISYYIYIYIYR